MKITHLVPSLDPGGPEVGLVDLATAGPSAGLEISVVALATASDTEQVSALRRLGVPVTELGLAPWDPRAVPRVVRALRAQRAQAVHSHGPTADVVGAAAANRARIPAVSTLHAVRNDPAEYGDRLRRSARLLARQRFMTRTIAISRVQQDWYRGVSGPGPLDADVDTVVVANGVLDPGRVDPLERARRRSALGVHDGEVLAVSDAPMRRDGSRGDGDHGHGLLLEACERLPDALPLVVALAGDGPLRPYYESLVDDSDELNHRVRFVHRHVDQSELLAAADMVLHTARFGAAPTLLLRAMAVARPVVATRVGGIPEIVSNRTGVLVPLDPAGLADALVGLTEDADRRAALGSAARERFLADFEAEGWARRLVEVYTSLNISR